MKKIIFTFIIIIANLNIINAVKPIVEKTEKQIYVEKKEFVINLDLEEILNLTPKSYEKATGKKMTFRDKIGLKITQKIIKRKQKKAAKKKRKLKKKGKNADAGSATDDIAGLLSMIFGILGAILLFLGGLLSVLGILFGIAGLVLGLVGLKDDNANRLFRILGIIFGGFVVLILIIGLIFIAAFFF